MQNVYFRLLGAKIGKNVRITSKTKLGEFDLLDLRDGCRVDSALIRGFCVEPDGYFRLDHIVVGPDAVINTYTQLSPGAVIAANAVYGPHSSSLEPPSPEGHVAYNATMMMEPHWILKLFVAWPVIGIVFVASCK